MGTSSVPLYDLSSGKKFLLRKEKNSKPVPRMISGEGWSESEKRETRERLEAFETRNSEMFSIRTGRNYQNRLAAKCTAHTFAIEIYIPFRWSGTTWGGCWVTRASNATVRLLQFNHGRKLRRSIFRRSLQGNDSLLSQLTVRERCCHRDLSTSQWNEW